MRKNESDSERKKKFNDLKFSEKINKYEST